MVFTLTQYEALQDAIAGGTLTVTYGDKTVTYRSITDMLRIVNLMEATLFPEKKNTRRKYAEYSKGVTPNCPDWKNEHFR